MNGNNVIIKQHNDSYRPYTPACIRKLCYLPPRHSFIRQEYFQLGHKSFTLDDLYWVCKLLSSSHSTAIGECLIHFPVWLFSLMRFLFLHCNWLNYISQRETGAPCLCRGCFQSHYINTLLYI